MAGAHRSSRPDTEATRNAILDAASALFAERGYVATTVDDIAQAAHVATGAVYTSVGGKQQVLEAVVNRFVEPEPGPDPIPESPAPVEEVDEPEAQPVLAAVEPVVEPVDEPDVVPGSADVTVRLTPDQITGSVDARTVVRDTVHTNRLATEAFADFYDLIHRNGTMEGMVADGATAAEDRMRRAADLLVKELIDMDALRTTVAEAVDLLAFFLGYLSWRRLTHDFGWSYDEAETWLTDRIGEALLTVEAQPR